ncbi:MAG: hypothetical protein ABIF89_02885, partial [bacterium]
EKMAGLQSKIKDEKQVIRSMILNKRPEREFPVARKPIIIPAENAFEDEAPKEKLKIDKKVELEEIEEKLEEILKP